MATTLNIPLLPGPCLEPRYNIFLHTVQSFCILLKYPEHYKSIDPTPRQPSLTCSCITTVELEANSANLLLATQTISGLAQDTAASGLCHCNDDHVYSAEYDEQSTT